MMRKVLACHLLAFSVAAAVSADVAMVEHKALRKNLAKPPKVKHGHPVKATGSQGLIDASGLKYFVNTNITFSTTSSASAAVSEANYTHAVAATTSGGGTTSSTLTDAFDGYNGLCLSLDNSVAQCDIFNPNFISYNENGPATTECRGGVSGVDRQVVFPVQTNGTLQFFRKVFVPANDSFARWLNIVKNTGAAPVTFNLITSNNLGSDINTLITGSSNGNNTAEATDTWVASFQNYSGTTSSDPRLGHVLQGPGAAVPLAGISFADGDHHPFWGYTFTLNPGETKILMNFVTGQPSKAAAAAKANELVGLPPNALQCLTTAERNEIANFQAGLPVVQVPTLGGIGLLALAAGLALAAMALLLRRRRSAAV